MSQSYNYPSSSASANPSVSGNGAAIPTSSTLVAGKDPGGLQKPVAVDSGGNIIIGSSALPTGAATAAKQDTGNTSLSSIDGKLPTGLTITSLRLLVDGSGVTQPISATVLPLPTGASTASLQTSGNATLTAIAGQLPATLGQKVMASSLAVTLASDQSTLPVSLASSPLPTGGATSALQTTGNTSLASIDTKTPALVSGRVPVDGSAVTQPISAASLPLPSGAATSALQSTISGQLPATLGQKVKASSLAVTLASDQGNLAVTQGGKAVSNAPVYNDYTSTPVTSASYVQVVASTTSAATLVEIFDSSGQPVYLAVGGSGSEVNQLIVYPGGNGQVPLAIAAGSRISLKSVSTSNTVGFITINLYG